MPKYYQYDKVWNRYRIVKTIKGKRYSYGTYLTEEEAKLVVEQLRECNWDRNELPRILKDLNIKSKVK